MKVEIRLMVHPGWFVDRALGTILAPSHHRVATTCRTANYEDPNPTTTYVSKPNVVAYFLPLAR